ncbi:methyltransferase family protein [Leptothrix discophora]|uniref:Isoprenylcysteine carboxylmethyltransferase family protein n=1 Tax=Leptothrix discophora TaxID=89 RepID=A0ABT9FYM3_LEPDI|nr:isoprenylcysteine carboxylmethyltransferase family protein [Leptothrix discophora]MDP4299339.1 isoprenylcysteine carboxylmethyltransferase family protein [Leptothrix discophora]
MPTLDTLDTRIPAPVIAGLAGLVMKAATLLAGLRIDPSAWRMHLGVALSQLSAVIALAALATMWRARTTLNPIHPERASRLVTGGIFRLSRNPLYLSLLLLLVAYAVRIDAWAAWLGPVVFWAYVTRFQIRPEERVLADKFGSAYDAYRRRTRRWI